MTKIIFGGKQFFLRTTRLTRDFLGPFGITPARFNMMIAIASQPRALGGASAGIAQHDLLQLLGVTSATISRMLKSLEELGYIVRTPHPRNPRFRWVRVTAGGLYRLRAAVDEIVGSSTLGWAVDEMLNPEPGKQATAAAAVLETDAIFTRVRERLGDIAMLEFPYDDQISKCARNDRLTI